MIPGACAVAALKLSSGAGAASVAVYDSANDDLNGKALKWFLDCSTTDNDSCIFVSPIEFKKGVLLVAEQGGDLGAIVCVERTGGSPD